MIALNVARLVMAGAVLVLAAAPWLFADTQLVRLTEFFSMLVLAIMWNMLAGYADIVTVGQHGFVGAGAYAFYGFAVLAGIDPYLSLPLAGVVAALTAGNLPQWDVLIEVSLRCMSVWSLCCLILSHSSGSRQNRHFPDDMPSEH